MSEFQAKIPGMKPIITQILGQMHTEYENGVMRAVQSVGFDVDKDRLEKALKDASAFYMEGFNDAMLNKSEWISIKERLPEEETLVLAYINGLYGSYCDVVRWDRFCRHVTHWMPIPEPPKEDAT